MTNETIPKVYQLSVTLTTATGVTVATGLIKEGTRTECKQEEATLAIQFGRGELSHVRLIDGESLVTIPHRILEQCVMKTHARLKLGQGLPDQPWSQIGGAE